MSGAVDCQFLFSTGLKNPMLVEEGFLVKAEAHLEWVTDSLGLTVEVRAPSDVHPYGSRYWIRSKMADVPDETLCDVAKEHSEWIEDIQRQLTKWNETPPVGKTETLEPKDCALFWYGFERIQVPHERWTRDYYIWRMQQAYSCMRGNIVEGCTMATLSAEQAGSVIWMLSELLHLDPHDTRMEVVKEWVRGKGKPWGRLGRSRLKCMDELQPSGGYDGNGYVWCENCGAVDQDDMGETGCPRRKCPVRVELGK